MGLESEAYWPQLVALKDKLSLRQLAKRFHTSPAAIVSALKRTGLSRKAVAPRRSSTKASKPEAMARSKRPGRVSKVEPFATMLGQVPDRVVAERAGVTVAAVRQFRAKRGIAAAVKAPAPAAAPTPQRGAWKVLAHAERGAVQWVVIASGLSDAARQAQGAGLGEVRSLSWVGVMV